MTATGGRKRVPRNPALEIAGTTVTAGRRASVEIPVAALPTGSTLSLPVSVAHGQRPGPTVWLSAAIHGDELNGVEIIRQVLAALAPRSQAGTVIAVPVVNVFGMVNESRYLPDRRDLNRSFPGSSRGSLASRLAKLMMTEVVDRSDMGIDLHAGTNHRTNLPQIRCDTTNGKVMAAARAFGAPVTIHAELRDGSLRAACARRGTPILLYEGGEAHRFDEFAISAGAAGVLRVLASLDMHRRPLSQMEPEATTVVTRTSWVRAGRSGLLRLSVGLGDPVTHGQTLGVIADAHGARRGALRAALTGTVIGHTHNPLVNRGDAVVHLADTADAGNGAPATIGGSAPA